MNDLAEQAVRIARACAAQIAHRPLLSAAVGGGVLSAVTMVAGARVGLVRATRPLTTWFGLQDGHGVRADDALPGATMLAALALLLLLWLVVTGITRQGTGTEAHLWWVAGAWAAPFALGPPLMDTSVYTSTAAGLLQRFGHDPYVFGPVRLHGQTVVFAIDPPIRDVASSVGPLGTLVQHLALSVSGGSALGAVIVLRAVAIAGLVWTARSAADLAAHLAGHDHERPVAARRVYALALVALNPLALLYLVSAAHLDGLMIGFVGAATLAAVRGRWWLALALATVGGSIVPVGFVAVAVLLVAGLARRPRPAVLARDLLVVAAVAVACALAVRDGLGWLRNSAAQFVVSSPVSPAGILQKVLAVIVPGASFDDLEAAARLTTTAAGLTVVGYLLWTSRRRSLVANVGWALFAVGLLAPVLRPWYLLWGLGAGAAVAAAAPRRVVDGTPSVRACIVALTTLGCLIEPPGFGPTTSDILSTVTIVVVGLILVGSVAIRRWTLEVDRSLLSAGR